MTTLSPEDFVQRSLLYLRAGDKTYGSICHTIMVGKRFTAEKMLHSERLISPYDGCVRVCVLHRVGFYRISLSSFSTPTLRYAAYRIMSRKVETRRAAHEGLERGCVGCRLHHVYTWRDAQSFQTTIFTEAVFHKCMLVRIDQGKLVALNRHPDGIKTLAERMRLDFCMFAALVW